MPSTSLSPTAPCAGRTRGLLVPACCGAERAGSGRMMGIRAGESPRSLEASLHCSPARGRAVLTAVVRAGESPRSPEAPLYRSPASGPGGPYDRRPGGGLVHPDRQRRRLAVGRPVGRAVPTTVVRAGARRTPIAGGVSAGQWAARFLQGYNCHPGGGLGHPDRRRRQPAVCRPVGRIGITHTLCCQRDAGTSLGSGEPGRVARDDV